MRLSFEFWLFSESSFLAILVFLNPMKYPIAIMTITTRACLAMSAPMAVPVKAAVRIRNWLMGYIGKIACRNQIFMKVFLDSSSPSLSASASTMGADIRAPPATGRSPITAGRRLTVTLEFLMNPPKLLVKTLTNPVSL